MQKILSKKARTGQLAKMTRFKCPVLNRFLSSPISDGPRLNYIMMRYWNGTLMRYFLFLSVTKSLLPGGIIDVTNASLLILFRGSFT